MALRIRYLNALEECVLTQHIPNDPYDVQHIAEWTAFLQEYLDEEGECFFTRFEIEDGQDATPQGEL